MKVRYWGGLSLALVMIGMAPLIVALEAGQIDEPWPTLLANEPQNVDHNVAILQLRANLAFDRLVQSGRTQAQ